MQCDMCGAESGLVRAKVEGTEMDLCKTCLKFGEIIPKRRLAPRTRSQSLRPRIRESETLSVVPDFYARIQKKRSELGLKQEELAVSVAEKASVIQKMESGSFTPQINLAKKLEKLLGITLTEKREESKFEATPSKSGSFTLGDFIKKR